MDIYRLKVQIVDRCLLYMLQEMLKCSGYCHNAWISILTMQAGSNQLCMEMQGPCIPYNGKQFTPSCIAIHKILH